MHESSPVAFFYGYMRRGTFGLGQETVFPVANVWISAPANASDLLFRHTLFDGFRLITFSQYT